MLHTVFLNDFPHPTGSASAVRVTEFVKLFKSQGHEITNIGLDYHSKVDSIGKENDEYYKNIGVVPKSGNKYIYKIFREKKVSRILEDELTAINNKKKINFVFISGFRLTHLKDLLRLSRKLSFELIVNMVEWHGKDNFPGILGKIRHLQNEIALRYIIPKMHNIVCISSYLQDYYNKKGCNTVRIPSILDTETYIENINSNNSDEIIFGYAGNPGKKDNILNFIKAIYLLNSEEKIKIHFNIFGTSEEDIIDLGLSKDILDSLEKEITFFGRIAFEQVKRELAKMDFTILIRPNKRSSQAGFPTKVPESLASGVPILLNLTSDLGMFLVENDTCIIIPDDSVQSCLNGIRKILSLNNQEIMIMKIRSKKLAKEKFDFRQYQKQINSFIKECKKNIQ